MGQAGRSQTNKLLGYPEGARLLLVNADDFGMYQAINEAVIRAFREGIVHSTSLMMPCPGAPRAVQLLKENPELRFGVHLSIVRDIERYRWGPMAPKERVPSLLDESGDLYSIERMPDLMERARLDELEVEFRAQIEAVLAAKLEPTHLDWHCLLDGGRPDVFDLTMGLAREYRLAVRVDTRPHVDEVQSQGLPTADHDLLDSFVLSIDDKPSRYAQMLRELPVGLSAWAVHPSVGSAESRAIDPDGWQVRLTDFDFLISPQAREIIREEGIILLGYDSIQRLWRDRSP